MPVRIIFRGLTLFQFPVDGEHAGKLVAMLVNNRAVTGGASEPTTGHPPGGHEHNHNADYQVLTGREQGADLVPKPLKEGKNIVENLDIVVPGEKRIEKARSFLRHVPNLDNIIERGTPEVRKALPRGTPNLDLVQHTVTVDRGTVLVRDVVMWDEAAYPLSGNPRDRGERPRLPAVAKFMGSDVDGHMATEVVVQIDDANSADIVINKEKDKKKTHPASDRPNPHVPHDTVEIVVTNYEYQRGKPVPWSFDFQWLFELAGYATADLAGREFDAWVPFARRYDQALFDSDRTVFFGSPTGTVGRPFPYLDSSDALTPMNPLTNELERPLCTSGTTTRPIIP